MTMQSQRPQTRSFNTNVGVKRPNSFFTVLARLLRQRTRRRKLLIDMLVILSMLLTPFSSAFTYSATSASAAVPTGTGSGSGVSPVSQVAQPSNPQITMTPEATPTPTPAPHLPSLQ